jgi:hypothetical protein
LRRRAAVFFFPNEQREAAWNPHEQTGRFSDSFTKWTKYFEKKVASGMDLNKQVN